MSDSRNRYIELLNKHKQQSKDIENAKRQYELQQKELELRQEELKNNLKEQKEIQKHKNDYEHLRKQLNLVESDLKNAYERYNKSIDPEFLKKREIEFIKNKLNILKKERNNVMEKLKKEYNIRTKCNNVSYKLSQTNNEYINNQNETIRDNKKNINNVTQKIQYKDRMVGINSYNVNNVDRRINIAITILGVIVAGLFPTILAFLNIIPARLALIAIIVFSIVGAIIVTIKFKKIPNRSKRIWELRNFKEPVEKKLTKDIVVSEEQISFEDQEEGESLEDILATKLSDSKKCS